MKGKESERGRKRKGEEEFSFFGRGKQRRDISRDYLGWIKQIEMGREREVCVCGCVQ